MSSKQRTFDDIANDTPDTQHRGTPALQQRMGSIITEPMGDGIRVTARNESDRLMWGFVAGPLALESTHVLVATYEALRDEIVKSLPDYTDKRDDGTPKTKQCLEAINAISAMLSKLRNRLSPKNVSDKTEKRAAECLPALRDIVTLLTYELTDKPGLPPDDNQ